MALTARTINDYSPTRPGSRDENRAINARREMMALLASATPHKPARKGIAAALARLPKRTAR